MNINIEKWAVSVFAVVGAFFLSGIGGAFIGSYIDFWQTPVAGFFAAFATVAVAYLTAPVKPKYFSLIIFIIGAALAFYLLKNESYPENYTSKAYQPTLLPFYVTLMGGFCALLAIFPSWGKR